MRRFIVSAIFVCMCILAQAVNVTVNAKNEKAAVVFRRLMTQTGMNFVYSTDLLKDVRVTVDVKDKPLEYALTEMFNGTEIEFIIKGNDIILKPKKRQSRKTMPKPNEHKVVAVPDTVVLKMLEEVVVVSRLESPVTETSEIGAKKISSTDVLNTPVLLGESDVIKSLQMQPGVTEGTEGMAGMNVHGGGTDENLYMIDNVPVYQANHFGGLFSAFNTDVIRYADFFKSSIPAKYDGRLSSFMDVRTKVGSAEGHHGSARIGLTSGSFNINGPIRKGTTYSVALRRSWLDVLTIPYVAIYNSNSDNEKARFKYAFMDFNGKVNHRFSDRAGGFVSVYFGHDVLKSGEKDTERANTTWWSDDKYDMYWGNFVAQTGFNYRFTSSTTAEFTAAYTRYFMTMEGSELYTENIEKVKHTTQNLQKSDNNINDWIFRGDFNRNVGDRQRVRYGANYIRHSFLPQRTTKKYVYDGTTTITSDSTRTYRANEANLYIEDEWSINDRFHINGGFHGTLFNIAGKTSWGYAPRISASFTPGENWAIKVAYSRTNQFVHQLTHTYLSLPTDQWIPITGKFKPESANKVSIGVYRESPDRQYTVSVEGYYKDMRNLVEYRDDYYLSSPLDMWNAQLCSGRGTAKGLDIKLEKSIGKFTGHIAYSLAWTDRTFAEKNGGKTYPARFDNRHTIKILANWDINNKVRLNAVCTGHSGNRFTLLPQEFVTPDFDSDYYRDTAPLQAPVNNYQLPFYHRLDMSLMVKNKRGYWTFGLYNAYCHRNTIGIRRGDKKVEPITPDSYSPEYVPVFQKVSLLPVIPSISYTWQF